MLPSASSSSLRQLELVVLATGRVRGEHGLTARNQFPTGWRQAEFGRRHLGPLPDPCRSLPVEPGRPSIRRLTPADYSVIVRYVPKYYDELDAVLRALADPTRRALVERLATSPAVVSELAAPFAMALPSLMQHLRVLENAGLVTSHKQGRVRTVSLRPGALDVLHVWLGEQRTPAEQQADRLGIHLTRTTSKET
jgi:DNA-binding transcriptional ArsR family regulator